jgi:hypothetical protein
MAKTKRLPDKESLENWVGTLAKQSLEAASTTKQERIEKREAKKRRRVEKKAKRSSLGRQEGRDSVLSNQTSRDVTLNENNKLLLCRVAVKMEECIEAYLNKHSSQRGHVFACSAEAKKARNKKINWDEVSAQPRSRDYGGIGLARPSILLDLDDPAFESKLQEEFSEHIPGFFGKQRTKAMKKQLDRNMLWRQLAEKKTSDQKVNGKKLSEMGPDERIEAMIQFGII